LCLKFSAANKHAAQPGGTTGDMIPNHPSARRLLDAFEATPINLAYRDNPTHIYIVAP
jgi:hypothetical protein